jgi:hypothetical protein
VIEYHAMDRLIDRLLIAAAMIVALVVLVSLVVVPIMEGPCRGVVVRKYIEPDTLTLIYIDSNPVQIWNVGGPRLELMRRDASTCSVGVGQARFDSATVGSRVD